MRGRKGGPKPREKSVRRASPLAESDRTIAAPHSSHLLERLRLRGVEELGGSLAANKPGEEEAQPAAPLSCIPGPTPRS